MKRLTLGLSALLAATFLATSAFAAGAAAATVAEPSARILRMEVAPALYELVYSPAQDAVFVASAGGFGEGAEAGRILRLDPRSLEKRAKSSCPAGLSASHSTMLPAASMSATPPAPRSRSSTPERMPWSAPCSWLKR